MHGNHDVQKPKRARPSKQRPQRQRKKPKLDDYYEQEDYEYDDRAAAEVENLTDRESDEDFTIEDREPVEEEKLIHVAAKSAVKKTEKSRAPLMPRGPIDDEIGDDPVVVDSLRKFLASLDSPNSADLCQSAYATIKANGGTDDVKTSLFEADDLRALLNNCDLRPVQRVILFNRISAAAQRHARSTKRKTRRS